MPCERHTYLTDSYSKVGTQYRISCSENLVYDYPRNTMSFWKKCINNPKAKKNHKQSEDHKIFHAETKSAIFIHFINIFHLLKL